MKPKSGTRFAFLWDGEYVVLKMGNQGRGQEATHANP